MPLVNRTQLENASVDCDTIETAVNGSPVLNGNGSFYSRLGIQLRTFASIIARFGTEFEAARDDAYNQIITGSAALTTAENKSLLVTLSGLVNAQTVVLKGYYAALDGGDQLLVYRSTGRSVATMDDGFFFAAGGGDDYFEAIDKSVANVKKFGAKGDGTTNDTARLQAAANAAATLKVPMYIPFGTYITSKISLTSKTEFHVRGEGTLKVLTPRWLGGIFDLTTCTDCSFQGITFDTNQTNLAAVVDADWNVPYCVGIKIQTACNNITIDSCKFVNLYMNHIHSYQCNNIRITNCYFESLAQNQQTQCDMILHTTGTGILDISNNRFIVTAVTSKAQNSAALLLSGHVGTTTVCNNHFDKCGRDNTGTHRVGVIDLYSGMDGVLIDGNRGFNNQHNFIRVSGCRNVAVTNNYGDTTDSSFADLAFVSIGTIDTIALRLKNILVKDNFLVSTQVSPTLGYAIGVTSLKWHEIMEEVTIENNVCQGFRQGMNIAGSYDRLQIIGNRITGSLLGILWTGSGITGTEASGKMVDLTASRNHIVVTSGVGISFPLTNPFTGTRGGRNIFSENYVSCTLAAIGMNWANHEYRNNRISGTASIGLYPRGTITYYRSGNIIDSSVVVKIDDAGTSIGNSGTSAGTGTLVTAGTGDVF